MTGEPALALLALLMCVGVPIFMAVVVALIVGVTVLIVRQGRALSQPDALEREAARLAPWTPQAFAGLAAEWRGTYARWPGRFVAAGYCPLRSDVERAGFICSYRRAADGHELRARTSEQQVRLSFGEDSFTAYVDERLVGVMRLSTGELFDPERRPAGQCRRAVGVDIFINGLPLGRPHRAYPLMLNGRQAAALVTTAGRGLRGGGTPLVAEQAPDLTRAEADWLLVMCVLEIGYYGSRRASAARSWRV